MTRSVTHAAVCLSRLKKATPLSNVGEPKPSIFIPMAISKKRKSSGKRKRPKFTQTPPEAGDERFGLRLKGSRLMYLKGDPDFQAVIRMGRLLNSIMFASQAMADYFGDESAT